MLKQMPGHVFSYIVPENLQVVMIFECISNGGDLAENQAYVDLGEPLYAGALPQTHGMTQIKLECKEMTLTGEVVGTHVLTIPLIPNRPINPVGGNRFLVSVTEHDVPEQLLPILRRRTIVLEVNYSLGSLSIVGARSSRPQLKFTKAFDPVIEELYPFRSANGGSQKNWASRWSIPQSSPASASWRPHGPWCWVTRAATCQTRSIPPGTCA